MKTKFMRVACPVIATAVLGASAQAIAAVTFSDTTFNLTDYTVSPFTQTGTIAYSQSATGGNPGSALQVSFSVPATSFSIDVSQIYFMNNGFTYNPSTQGAIGSISFSIDKSATIFSPPGFGLANGQVFVLEQGGSFYGLGVPLGSTQGIFQTASIATLNATDFDLITNQATGAEDTTSHPSFASGAIDFGFKTGLGVPANTGAASATFYFDNYNVSVGAVPEPETYALMLMGLVVLAATALRRRGARVGSALAGG